MRQQRKSKVKQFLQAEFRVFGTTDDVFDNYSRYISRALKTLNKPIDPSYLLFRTALYKTRRASFGHMMHLKFIVKFYFRR